MIVCNEKTESKPIKSFEKLIVKTRKQWNNKSWGTECEVEKEFAWMRNHKKNERSPQVEVISLSLVAIEWPFCVFSSCSGPALVRIASRRRLAEGKPAAGMVGRRRPAASEGRLAWDTANWAVPPSRVHFEDTRPSPRGEWRRSIRMPRRPMQRCKTNRTRCVCCLSKAKTEKLIA